MKLLVKNIRGLAGAYENAPKFIRGSQLENLPLLENAYLAIEDGIVSDFGSMDDLSGIADWRNLEIIDAEGRYVLPSWCDSHTHLVFAASRELEFEDRIKGMTYEQIANRGGGILNSAAKLSNMSEDELFEKALIRLNEAAQEGTGAMEIKSGYGLTTETELKMLRVIKRLRAESGVAIKATFLGAHAIPAHLNGDKEKYVNQIIEEMIPAVAAENLADYIDAFCEKGYFDVDDTMRIVEAGAKVGLKSKIHVNQFNVLGAIPKLVAEGAISVDHLEVMEDADVQALSTSNTIATALPLCSLFLSIPYTPIKPLLDADAIIALATDFNPGSAPSSNMSLAVSLACIKMKMTPNQAINAATLNGAAAMELSDTHGSLAIGKVANFIITSPCDHLSFLPYSFGKPAIDGVVLNGEPIKRFDW